MPVPHATDDMRISLVLTLALLVPVTAHGSQEHHGTPVAGPVPAAASTASVVTAPVSRKAPTATVATVVERLQQRVAEHHAAKSRPEPESLRQAPPKAPRVQLVWRLSVTWPPELTRPATAAEPSALPAPGRVRLGWMGPEP